MKLLKRFWLYILPYIKNKYILTSIIFFLWILIFDNNNLVTRMKKINNLKQLQKEKLQYIEQIENDTRKLEELKTNKENLEKFAREQYLMKKDNEDVFIIIDEDEE